VQEASIAAKKAREIVEIARKNKELLENGVQSKRQGRRGVNDLIGEDGFRVEIGDDIPVQLQEKIKAFRQFLRLKYHQ